MVRAAIEDLREVTAAVPDTGPRQLKSYPFLPHLQGSSIAYDARARRLLVADSFAGTVTAVDADTLVPAQTVAVCAGPEQVLATPTGAVFVSCRHDRRVVALDANLAVTGSVTVGPEPFGLAASRRGGWLYVTTAGDSRLHRLAARTLSLSFSRQLADGARGVGVTRDGKYAVVAHLTGGIISLVDLHADATHAVRLPGRRDGGPGELLDSTILSEIPRRQPGAAFAVAMSPGGLRAFVPYALRNPTVVGGVDMNQGVCGTTYGSDTPIIASVASVDLDKRWVQRPKLRELPEDQWSFGDFMGMNHQAELGVVRAAVHDPHRARLLVVGEGSGLLVSFDTSMADPTTRPRTAWQLGGPARGVAIDPDGRRAFVHLAIDGQLAVVDLPTATEDADDLERDERDETAVRRVALRPDDAPQAVDRGRRLFYQANDERTSTLDGVGCASCHLEGRSDGITWSLGARMLQTPVLAGRMDEAGPFRWHGDSPDLAHAVGEAIERLDGDGLSDSDTDDLMAYLRSGAADMTLPDHLSDGLSGRGQDTARRGRAVFEAQGCASCHDPERNFSDGLVHSFRGGEYRTPSLVGVSRSAPYYHDGSARSLRAVIDAHEPDNPMAVGGALDHDDRQALLRYLSSL